MVQAQLPAKMFNWVEIGWGQIIAWNKKNKRTMVVFSNESPANDLAAIYRDWSRLP